MTHATSPLIYKVSAKFTDYAQADPKKETAIRAA
jgi:hypothetical protein